MQIVSRLIVLFLIASAAYAACAEQPKAVPPVPEKYRVEPPSFPAEDHSGNLGPRLLRLLSIQAERNLRWIEEERRTSGITDGGFVIPDGRTARWPKHVLYQASGSAYLFAVLSRFGAPGQTMAGVSKEELAQTAVAMIRAVAQSHPVSRSAAARASLWPAFSALRVDHTFGMAAWFMWDDLDEQTQLLVARILEHDADHFHEVPVPARLYGNTHAESNAWTGSGLAVAYCMLKSHPRRNLWEEKAKEFMISAYATERDIASDRIVDGRPLKQWLKAPNAFPDYTVENHGFVHPVYIAAVSEMVRSAICYRLADEPLPDAVTFNADKVFDVLTLLNLPDGNHLNLQGTDYIDRNLGSFFQACNVVPLKPDPLRSACFLRSLASIETMATERPEANMSGAGMFFSYDLGMNWGLTQNYLMGRLFGSGDAALPEDQIEARLAGVHINELGKFVIHRTARTLSSFSWQTTAKSNQVMALTLPLDKDVLCSPQPTGSYIGHIHEQTGGRASPLSVVWHKAAAQEDGFGVLLELDRCSGKVRQNSAFVSLPDGRSVYLEERIAVQALSVVAATSGNVTVYDDLRWPFQKKAREFFTGEGELKPDSATLHSGNWANIDGRMGYVALGGDMLQLTKSASGYHTWELAFRHDAAGKAAATFQAGQRMSAFALVSSPNHTTSQTAGFAERLKRTGWKVNRGGVLAIEVGQYLVYANFSTEDLAVAENGLTVRLSPRTAGWSVRGAK